MKLKSPFKRTLSGILQIIFLGSFKNIEFNPSGSYKLLSKTKKIKGEIFGYIGQVDVKKFNEKKIIISFLISKGAPSYNLGSFIDTLDYLENKSIYMPEFIGYPDCKIYFNFSKKGITVRQEGSFCGFGMGITADGYFKKVSSKEPEIEDLLSSN